MPVSATAPAIAAAVSFAASYLTWSRWPTTSAEKSSSPARFLNRRSSIATSSRQSMPSILNVDSACSSQAVQVGVTIGPASSVVQWISGAAPGRQCATTEHGEAGPLALLHVFKSLCDEPDDMLGIEAVEDLAPVAAGADDARVAQQPQLMRHGRLAQTDVLRDVEHTQLRP